MKHSRPPSRAAKQFVKALATPKPGSGPMPPFFTGTVTAVTWSTTPPTIMVEMVGESVSVGPYNFLNSYVPLVGDVAVLAKQGAHVFALGTISPEAGGGWITPTYNTHFSAGTPTGQWRIVNDNGALKVQFKGVVDASSPSGAFWSLPSIAQPSASRMLGVLTNAGIEQLNISTSGAVSLSSYSSVTAILLDSVEYFI